MSNSGEGRSIALLYATRIVRLASELDRCHRLGVVAGEHDGPWELGFQRLAVPIYLETLSIEFLRDLGVNFVAAAEALEHVATSRGPHDGLSASWRIVRDYLRNATAAVVEHPVSSFRAPIAAAPLEVEPTTPSVLRFDLLAGLVSASGVKQLGDAANRVIAEIEQDRRPVLDEEAIELLRGLVAGKSVVDLATQIGRSERQTYRTLSEVWATLGVQNRRAGLVRAAELGYLDDAG